MVHVPKGNKFLINVSLSELKSLYLKEENSKVKIRLQAAILRKKDKTLDEISEIIGYPLTTVGDWLRRIYNGGLGKIQSKKQTGRPSRLREEQKQELKNILEKSPEEQNLPYKVWTTKLLAYFIDENYHVKYKIRNVEKLVHRLGFSIKKARPEHQKVNKELQIEFKKKFKNKFNQHFTMDSRSFVLMKSTSM